MIKEKDLLNNEIKKKSEEFDKTIQQKTNEITEKEKLIKNLLKSLDQKTQTLSEKQLENEELKRQIQENSLKLTNQEQENQNLQKLIQQKDNEILNKERKLQTKDDELARNVKLGLEMKAQLAQIKEENNSLQLNLSQAQKALKKSENEKEVALKTLNELKSQNQDLLSIQKDYLFDRYKLYNYIRNILVF